MGSYKETSLPIPNNQHYHPSLAGVEFDHKALSANLETSSLKSLLPAKAPVKAPEAKKQPAVVKIET